MVELSDNAEIVMKSRYALHEKETWDELSRRVALGTAEIEKDSKYVKLFEEIISEMLFIPAGRILRNIGRPKGNLLNCFGMVVGDSISEIAKWKGDSLILWSDGGGVGVNISQLRPEGAPITGKGGSSSGPVSFLTASNADAETIKTGGSRRAAGLALMLITHPDVLKFIDAKSNSNKLNNYNISVGITEEFLDAVESNKDWTFRFAQKNYQTMPAREIWNKICENMMSFAEPGLINWDNLRENNSYYYSPVEICNPCQPKYATVLKKTGLSTIENTKIGD